MNEQIASRPARMIDQWKLLCEMELEPASTRPELGVRQVVASLDALNLPRERLDRIRAVMLGALEGCFSRFSPGEWAPAVQVQVLTAEQPRRRPGSVSFPAGTTTYDSDKREALSPSSWGFFVIEKSTGIGRRTRSSTPYLIELFLYPER